MENNHICKYLIYYILLVSLYPRFVPKIYFNNVKITAAVSYNQLLQVIFEFFFFVMQTLKIVVGIITIILYFNMFVIPLNEKWQGTRLEAIVEEHFIVVDKSQIKLDSLESCALTVYPRCADYSKTNNNNQLRSRLTWLGFIKHLKWCAYTPANWASFL